MRNGLDPLPIDEALPRLFAALRAASSAVLVAPPGAGKTTRVPLALLDQPWLAGKKILMLEPRRLAARAAANRMAQLLGERVGESVGYRVRMDARAGPRTRLEVVTEGILTRMIVHDPTLENVGLVIFDEFHERSVHADVGLALTLRSRDLLREDLKLLVMSATLDGAAVADLLGGAPTIVSEGRSFAVETRYVPVRDARAREAAVAAVTLRALREHSGDVLVFLPGAAEIRRAAAALEQSALHAGTRVMPLFSAMSLEDQDQAVRPGAPGARKVVLATTIAQTSLTIEGVRVVVDSGVARVPRYDVRTGMTRLATVPVSRAAADQRRGRAGRVAAGVCYRLWDPGEDAGLRGHDTPEIREADLAPLALDLAAAGVTDPAELRWLDPPPGAAFAQARELLRELGALGRQGTLSSHGRSLASLGTHPRLAHMLLAAHAAGQGALACDLVALLEERDIMTGAPHERDSDVRTRLEIVREKRMFAGVDRGVLQRVRSIAARWRERLGVSVTAYDVAPAGWVLALAYPDRIAQRRPGSDARFLLRNGVGAALPAGSALHHDAYLVAAELDGRRPESLVLLAAPLSLAEIESHHGDEILTQVSVAWDDAKESVSARRTRELGTIVLSDDPLPNPDPAEVARVVEDAIVARGFAPINWTREAVALRQRLAFLHAHDARWPDVSDDALRATTDRWLTPHLGGVRRRADIARIPVAEGLLQLLTWQQRAALDDLAPTHLTVPSGSRIPIDYSDARAPVLAVRLQEVFGLTRTPAVLSGRVPLTLHLLSPSQRPVQVTSDLESFWRTSYFDVRKELRGRYPKHHWPEDPLAAEPTRRTKRR